MKDTPLKQQELDLLKILESRFNLHTERHEGVTWTDVRDRITSRPEKLRSLLDMEMTGGEPDVVSFDEDSKAVIFVDCSPESPAGRRNLCYDEKALAERKRYKPESSAQQMAHTMGIELLDEFMYRRLQQLGIFDTKTSSWIQTPEEIRNLGGALFGDRRYDTVFIYHNGATSYYGARGFRGKCEF